MWVGNLRPGFAQVDAEEEASRVLPMIEEIRRRFDVPISVDTYKASVAEQAIQAGADLVNDVWGLKKDPAMAGVIAKHGVACCLMHNKKEAVYDNFLVDMLHETQECVNLARLRGFRQTESLWTPAWALERIMR